MCTNYRPTSRDLLQEMMGLDLATLADMEWPDETWKDYNAPIIRLGLDGQPECAVASFGFVPRRHVPATLPSLTTMNARSETVGQLRSYSKYWRTSQLCLVPMTGFYEPNYESGKAVRWQIAMADKRPFAVAGMWRSWEEPDGSTSNSFTQLTINADGHPLLKRFHKPDDEKRTLVVVPPEAYGDWLSCRDPEFARAFLNPYPHELMHAWEDPRPPAKKKTASGKQQSLLDF